MNVTDEQLLELLTDLESDDVERTSAFRDADKLGEAICAFANDLPDRRRAGVLFVGVNSDCSCAGIDISDQLLQNLAAIRSDGNLLPQPSMTVEKRCVRDCEVAVIASEEFRADV